MNKYGVFIKIIETGSFTRTAEEIGYTQSAISQIVNSLEDELSTKLILRSRKGIELTPDGKEYLPYIKTIYHSYLELMEKNKEMQGLEKGIVRIGTFSSVSCIFFVTWSEVTRLFATEYLAKSISPLIQRSLSVVGRFSFFRI